MPEPNWQFFIDVGGTFTDVVARPRGGDAVIYKLLSSGAVRGTVGDDSTARIIRDDGRRGDPDGVWTGYELTLLGDDGASATVLRFDAATGSLELDRDLPGAPAVGAGYQLSSGEEAPVTAIRYLMGLRLDQSAGAIEVRLGTTRATNALLERKGARSALLTTCGFADVLAIGNQDRPDLSKLDIRKRDELTERVVEMHERIGPRGEVFEPLDEGHARDVLRDLADAGIESLAICLLHAHVNPAHEEALAAIAASMDFAHVSVSSRVSRMERIVPRGDTTVVDGYLSPVIQRYVRSIRASLPEARFTLMTSAGGLVEAGSASGKDTLLSGPAGGVVGCAFVGRRDGTGGSSGDVGAVGDVDAAQAEACGSGGTPVGNRCHTAEACGSEGTPVGNRCHTAEACGSEVVRVIGFDMGGTSTDVSRFDSTEGGFEYQHETVNAGVRVMTPTLAVETVAAGGGSICAFDGQKLTVGPHSAGADPGPACYGRGGPLTVTDVNVLLGRVPHAHFPFPLDVDAIRRRMAELQSSMANAPGDPPDDVELAEGFLRIADNHMAAAIKRISIARGYDLREYTLVAFGGAGGQHACAVARMLGMSRVLLSPMAGVLSALGIGAADRKEIRQRTLRAALDDDAAAAMDEAMRELESEARESLHGQGIADDSLAPPARTVDLCYRGESSLITVPHGPLDDMRDRFAALHRQHYGYAHEHRSIEVGVVRVELVAPGRDPALPKPERASGTTPEPFTSHRAVFEGKPMDVPLFRREALRAGHAIEGPAIVIEPVGTVVIAPGWTARMTALGDLELRDVNGRATIERVSTDVDPIRLELFHNHFASIAEQMGTTLRRIALSTNVKERLDFSCAVFTADGDLVANAPHIPVHLGGMSDCVKALIEDVPTFAPGDVFVTNDPYRGGSHLNDVTVITPVHQLPLPPGAGRGEGQSLPLPPGEGRDEGKPLPLPVGEGWGEGNAPIMFFVASRAHHAEIGGKRPGSMPPDSTSLADEGVLIRALPYVRSGTVDEDALREVLTAAPYSSRAPDENLADVAAQAAANRTGERELRRMVERFGIDVVRAYMGHIQRAAARKMESALRALPPGAYTFEDGMDDGTRIRLTATIDDGRAILDFTGTDPVTKGNLNANRAIVSSAVLYCLRCLIDEDIPLNSGVLEPVTIVLPECFLNPTAHADPAQCPAVAGGNVETSQRIVDCIFGALGTVAASQGTMNNLLIGDNTFGYYETICGGAGAGPTFPGASAVHTHMTNTRLTDPEVLESRYPLRLHRFAVRAGSGGRGRFAGGDGVIREIEFLAPLDVSIISNRRTTQPYGLAGGAPGKAGRNVLIRGDDGSEVDLGATAQVSVARGDRLIIETPGGGGYGGSS